MCKDFKLTLKACRVNKGLTQNDLAKKIGVNRSTVIKWEQGKSKPNRAEICLLSQITGIPVNNISLP